MTKDSIKITWDAPASTEGIAGYKIYVNGAVYAADISKDAVGYTLSGLKAGETYQIQVVAVGTDEHATDKNQNSTVNKAAKTGDMTNVVFPAAVMLLAGAVVAGVLFRRKWMK